jgi:hypothetical protein
MGNIGGREDGSGGDSDDLIIHYAAYLRRSHGRATLLSLTSPWPLKKI